MSLLRSAKMLRKMLILAFVAAIGVFCLSGCKKSQPAPTPAPSAPKAAVEQKPAAEPAKAAPAPEIKEELKPEAAPEVPKAEPAKAAPETPAEPVPVEPNPAK
jgi:hypothetical protein